MPKKKTVAKKTSATTTVTRAVRPKERIPVGGHRDKLGVTGRDPNYFYRWVEDIHEAGQEIFNYIQGGYTFAPKEGLNIGENFVYASENVGSVVRKPSGDRFLFLMRLPLDLYEQDQRDKQKRIDETEEQMIGDRNTQRDDGQYGGGKFEALS